VQLPTAPNRAKNTELILGSIFFALGLLLLVAGGVQLALYLGGFAGRLTIEPIVIPAGLAFGIPGALMLRRALSVRRVMRRGIPGEAEVVRVEPTLAEVDGHPVVRLHLRVMLSDQAPYEVGIRWILGPYDGMRLVAGRVVPVKVDPKNRRAVVIA
jgi:hypothetical protein